MAAMTEKHRKMIDELYAQTTDEVKEKYDKRSGIYGIYCDDKLVYIGKSTNLLNRWIAHKCHVYCEESKEYNRPIYRELRRALQEGHTIQAQLIEYCETWELEDKEDEYIIKYYPALNTMVKAPNGNHYKKAIKKIC